MKPLPLNARLLDIAPRVIWFEPPEQALANPLRFLAYAMTYGTPEDLAILRQHVPDSAFLEVLNHPPPGIMDARSWTYWNVMADKNPVPPMPRRHLPD